MIKNKENILIAGGTGFIGSNLCKSLSKTKFNVFSCSTKKPNKYNKLFGVKYIKCDLSKKKQIENKLNRNFDYIVNLSGYINHSNAKKVKLTHYEACKNLANFFKKKKLKNLFNLEVALSMDFLKVRRARDIFYQAKILNRIMEKLKITLQNIY